jgi:hypothetical protein
MPANQNGSTNGTQGEKKPTLSWSTPVAPVQATAGAAQPIKAVTPTPMQKSAAAAVATKSSSGKIVGWVIAVVVVVALAGWGLVALHSKNTAEAPMDTHVGTNTNALVSGTNTSAATQTAPTSGGSASIVIPSPQNAGMRVTVSQIDVPASTWVVVYEDRNGKPGNALGAAWFSQGMHSGVVELLRGTLAGQSYLVGESRDNGDKVFSLQTDQAVSDAQGNPLWVPLQVR